jgi:hypothetical protein
MPHTTTTTKLEELFKLRGKGTSPYFKEAITRSIFIMILENNNQPLSDKKIECIRALEDLYELFTE